MRLTREVRVWLDDRTGNVRTAATNSWAGTDGGIGSRRFVVFRVTVAGKPDPRTGYLCDIRELEALVRGPRCREIAGAMSAAETTVSSLCIAVGEAFQDAIGATPPGVMLTSLELALSPYSRLTVEDGVPAVLKMTQSFEFSASHRLAIPALSDAGNRELFGKCANPHGHGHNYLLEVTIAGEVTKPQGTLAHLGAFDRVVRENILEPFDHKNLNIDCPEFADLNPTVENIALVIFARLVGKFQACRLDRVRVWETARTFAEVTHEDFTG